MSSDTGTDRRSFLKAAGGAAVAATLAGCAGQTPGESNGGGGGGSGNGSGGGGGGNGGGGGGGGNGGGGDGAEANVGGSLIYSRGEHPTNYDPQQTTSGEVAKVTNQIFDPLIRFVPGSGGELQSGLATEYSLDGTTATLTLREGVTFHNGDEFTAADFKATYRRFTDSDYRYYLGDANRSGYAGFTLGNWVESVDASQDYQLTIELVQPYAPFLRNLAMFASVVLSQAQIESLGASPDAQAQLGQNPQGTGPFTFEESDDANQRVLLGRNDEYWAEGPFVEQVVFDTIGDNSTRAQSVINGDSHIIDGLGTQASTLVQNSNTATLLEKDGINIGYMAFNLSRKEEFRDRRVRQAVSYAVNTQVIVEEIYAGFATQAEQPVPPNVLGHNDDLQPYENDKERARQLLSEAGVEDLSFQLATFSNPRGYNPSPQETAQQVRSDLADVGIEVTIDRFSTFSSFLEYTNQGRHDACFLGWYTDNADPDNFFYVLLDPKVDFEDVPDGQDWVAWDTEGFSTLNVAAWANREYMELVREAQATYDEATREELYNEAAVIAHEEAPWVYIDYANALRGVNEAVNEDSYTVSAVGGPYLNLVQFD